MTPSHRQCRSARRLATVALGLALAAPAGLLAADLGGAGAESFAAVIVGNSYADAAADAVGPIAGAATSVALPIYRLPAVDERPAGPTTLPAIAVAAPEQPSAELGNAPVEQPGIERRANGTNDVAPRDSPPQQDAIVAVPPIDDADVVDPPTPPSPAAAPAADTSAAPTQEMVDKLDAVWSHDFPTPPLPQQPLPQQPVEPQERAALPPAPPEQQEPLPSPPQPTLPPLEAAADVEPGENTWDASRVDVSDEAAGLHVDQSAMILPDNIGGSAPRPLPYAPATAELSRQLLPTVQRGYGLAQHGAIYAAQTEFIQVLRRVAEAKDAAQGVDTHARALAAGLRALDEADDFAPQGAQLEADVDVAQIASSHRTPLARDEVAAMRPAEAIAAYLQFARGELAAAAAGEQAGSMALYGLGKVQNRLARDADGELRHERRALTMFLAALDAGPGNYLAANEVGVLLSRAGQPGEATLLFRRSIDIAPTSTAYHNLAVVERTLGYRAQADANERYGMYLASRDRAAGAASRASGVRWVSPQQLGQVGQPLPIAADQDRLGGAPQQAQQPPPRRSSGTTVGGHVQSGGRWSQNFVPGVFRR